MFGRKAKRIAALEKENKDLRENLAVAVVPVGHAVFNQRITVEKGKVYRVAYSFRHTGAKYLDLAELFIEREDASPTYFDGSGGEGDPLTYTWMGGLTDGQP